MTIKIPEVDVKSGLDLCDGNMNIYINALRLFASGTPEDLKKMKVVTKENLADYAIAVHSVKSMSNYIGAEEARKTAKNLEALAKGGDLDGVLAHNDKFIKYAESLVENVQNWLNSEQNKQ